MRLLSEFKAACALAGFVVRIPQQSTSAGQAMIVDNGSQPDIEALVETYGMEPFFSRPNSSFVIVFDWEKHLDASR
jgi:hypothetical protein